MTDPSPPEENSLADDAAVVAADEASQSKKTEVLKILFDALCPSGKLGTTRAIAKSSDVIAAIHERNRRHPSEPKKLSSRNVANFLKDFIRVPSCNRNWPRSLTDKHITARQVYGSEQVLEFVPFSKGDTLPFPDRFDPVPDMPVTPFETLSIPIEARALGREDEPWLIQVAVSQRIVHAHLAIHASRAGLQVDTLAHLQTSVKTQPEIDATFVATARAEGGHRLRFYVTVEAKQIRERILEHQIREQVSKAFEFTSPLKGDDAIDGVLPIVLKVVEHAGARGIYVVQFQPITRTDFQAKFAQAAQLHEMPLTVQSRSFFSPQPMVAGISYRAKTLRMSPAAKPPSGSDPSTR